MSLLHQEDRDASARGEELTKGTSHVVIATIIAVVVVAAAIAIYVITGQKPPVATGEVLEVWAHPLHSETSRFDASGAAMAQDSFDQVFVFCKVRLHSQSKGPLFLTNILTNATLPDGVHSSYAATAGDYNRIFVAYPDLTVPHGQGLSLNAELQPGQTVEGTFVSAFKIDKQTWDQRKALDFTFAFRFQPNLVLKPKVPVIER